MNLGSAKGGNILAMLALILGMILTWITMIENALVIHEKIKKLKTKQKHPARRKQKWFWAEERSPPSFFYTDYNNLPMCKQYEKTSDASSILIVLVV